MDNQFSISITNKRAEIGSVIEAFESFRQSHHLSEKVNNTLQLAIDELISNIIEYAMRTKKSTGYISRYP